MKFAGPVVFFVLAIIAQDVTLSVILAGLSIAWFAAIDRAERTP